MTYAILIFAIALAVVYGLFHLLAPPQARAALHRAHTGDAVACALVASVIALAVML